MACSHPHRSTRSAAMSPAPVPLHEEAPGVLRWSRWNVQRQMDFNGTIVLAPDGNVAVDPPDMDEAQIERLRSLGGLRHVVITNRHHARGSEDLRQRFAARVLVHRA